ncbi:MAG: Maf family nucleotide pyrophosphatase [Terracidiphilus sp.]
MPNAPFAEPVSMIRVFVSSPGDVPDERRIVGEVLNKINESDGGRNGVRLVEFAWEQNVVPKIGLSVQANINAQTPAYGIYVGIMGARFGTPTGGYGSGTEFEFEQAFADWQSRGTPWILFYFRNQPIQSSDPAQIQQYKQVAEFRRKVGNRGMIRTYADPKHGPDNFADKLESDLRGVLAKFVVQQQQKPWMLITSSSPRRQQLLEQIGLHENVDFVMEAASVALDSIEAGGGSVSVKAASNLAICTARAKIQHAISHMIMPGAGMRQIESKGIVVGADTIVLCEGVILDNPLPMRMDFAGPQDLRLARENAINMLRSQSGKHLSVITGLVVALADDPIQERSLAVVTEAKLRELNEYDIEQYVDSARPLDRAGGLCIQDQGVALFQWIKGSYTNVVGLPLVEFFQLLQDPLFSGHARFPQVPPPGARGQAEAEDESKLSLVSVGDINYDFVYNELKDGFFDEMRAPGAKILGKIIRRAGGTAVNFAKGARKAGFGHCTVVGVVGGDALGDTIERELKNENINTVLPRDLSKKTSIAIIFRDKASRDTSLTLTDARQGLPKPVAEQVQPAIIRSDALYVSGYCLIDPNRVEVALNLLKFARRNEVVTILDAVVRMNESISFETLVTQCSEEGHSTVDVLVSELPEIMGWLNLPMPPGGEMEAFDFLRKEGLLARLHQHFKVLFLRTSSYSHELISTRSGAFSINKLEYPSLGHSERLGYGDHLTARHIFNYLAPRVLLASQSPQRLELLKQIVAPNKVIARRSGLEESTILLESPEKRVQRLALEKALEVRKMGDFPETIEIVIGADTEAVCTDDYGAEVVKGHPHNNEEAREILQYLSGRRFSLLTGLAVIGRRVGASASEPPVQVVEQVQTWIRFRKLTESEIEAYILTGEPFGRAGAFAIQGRGALLVESLEGSYSNVVGLPLERLSAILEEHFAMPIWDINKVSNWRLAPCE